MAQYAYGTVITLVKASILALYFRIFPSPSMLKTCRILGGVAFAWWLVVVIVSTVECRPIQKVWNQSIHGTCIDACAFLAGTAVPNVVMDAAILVLPCYQVSRLKMRRLQKAAVSGIFLLGGL